MRVIFFYFEFICLLNLLSSLKKDWKLINLPSSIILKSSHCVQFYIDYCYCKFCIKEEEEEYMIEKQ